MRPRALWASGLALAAGLAASPAWAAPSVWVVDDGEKVHADVQAPPLARGEDNPVWQPREPVRLFAMRNETVALQVVVQADADALEAVSVELPPLLGPGEARIQEDKADVTGRTIQRFVEYFRRGVPDALIPVELARGWAPYPLLVPARTSGAVWIDVQVPRDQPAGTYRGEVVVKELGGDLARVPLELEVVDATLPDRTVAFALDYDREELVSRVSARAEFAMWKLLHAHRIAPLHDAVSPGDVDHQGSALSGALYTRSQDYQGPAPGMGDGVLTVGAHGAFAEPDERSLARVESIAQRVSALKLFGSTDVVFYAAEEHCSSGWGAGWKTLLRHSEDADARRMRVGWTCTQDPTAQPVDVPILRGRFDAALVSAARAQGKESWVYGAASPRTGSFRIDDAAVSPRVDGWLSAMFRVPRWLYGTDTRWSTQADEDPFDPFADHAPTGDDGDGWTEREEPLLYPGAQRDLFPEHSLDYDGVLPSIRLKNWRRGIEDAGYLQMARERDPARADAIARWLVPAAFDEARPGEAPSWGTRGAPFFDARRALLAIILGREPVALPERVPAVAASVVPAVTAGCSRGMGEGGAGLVLVLGMGTMAVARSRGRRGARSPASRA